MAPWSALLRRTAPWLASCLVLANVTPSHAQTVTLTRDYDLVDDSGLVHYSQTDGRWAYYSIRRDPSVTIGRCGCLLSAFATVINQQGGMLPWFPTAFDYFGGSNGAFDFNPRYLDIFLNYGPNPSGNPGLPDAPFPPGWGYKERPDGTCGVIPLLQALQSVGNDGFGHPIGFTPVVHHGFGPDVKNIVNRNLLAGRPTIAAIRVGDTPVANHAVLIAGWDQQDGVYKILDPMTPRLALRGLNYPEIPYGSNPGDPPEAPATYQAWEARVEGIIEMRLGGFTTQPSFLFGDDPSPIEILMTGPDGRRTGVDAATGTSVRRQRRRELLDVRAVARPAERGRPVHLAPLHLRAECGQRDLPLHRDRRRQRSSGVVRGDALRRQARPGRRVQRRDCGRRSPEVRAQFLAHGDQHGGAGRQLHPACVRGRRPQCANGHADQVRRPPLVRCRRGARLLRLGFR